jgi:hypothetical protein
VVRKQPSQIFLSFKRHSEMQGEASFSITFNLNSLIVYDWDSEVLFWHLKCC